MVHLTRIYTRTGDDGSTALGDFSRTHKNDPRLLAYAGTDETSAAIGVALALGDLSADITAVLLRIQQELFDVGADLATPVPRGDHRPDREVTRIDGAATRRLERDCDRFNADLEPLRSFVLPGGTPGAALLHVARTQARQAERQAWAAIETHGRGVNVETARFLNRLSDLLFILARRANAGRPEVLWEPLAEREQPTE